MLERSIYYNMTLLSPRVNGGSNSAYTDPRLLLLDLQSELREVRSRRDQAQQSLDSRRKAASNESKITNDPRSLSVFTWVVVAAGVLALALLFYMGVVEVCGSCGRVAITPMLVVLGIIFAVRGIDEYTGVRRDLRSERNRRQEHENDCRRLIDEISECNRREVEIKDSIEAIRRRK